MGLIIVLITPMNAQSVSLGPQIGYFKAEDADGNFMGGVAWRFKFTSLLGLEASINYRHEKYADGALTVRSWPVMVTGLIYPIPIVYGAIGTGWYSVTYDYDQDRAGLMLVKDETTQKVGWHFGGGVELPMGSNFKLTGDIRYVFLDYDFKEIPGSNDSESNFTVLTIGLLFDL